MMTMNNTNTVVVMLGLCMLAALAGLLLLAPLMDGVAPDTLQASGVAAPQAQGLTVLKAPPFARTNARVSPHVGTDHRGATEEAYRILERCGTGLKVFDCSRGNPPGFYYVCPVDETRAMCAIAHTGYGHSRLTGWMMSCLDAYAAAALCTLTTITTIE